MWDLSFANVVNEDGERQFHIGSQPRNGPFYLIQTSESYILPLMSKRLSEMTLEELWKLFPISLVPPNDKWKELFLEMEGLLRDVFAKCETEGSAKVKVHRISHIGSTAIKGIWAKDIVDILVELESGSNLKTAANALEHFGFIIMSNSDTKISLNYGYTEKGFAEKVYHVHLRHAGDCDEIYFRDYLNSHEGVAKEYEALKLKLWKLFEFDRDGYTNAKSDFIAKVMKMAKTNL